MTRFMVSRPASSLRTLTRPCTCQTHCVRERCGEYDNDIVLFGYTNIRGKKRYKIMSVTLEAP